MTHPTDTDPVTFYGVGTVQADPNPGRPAGIGRDGQPLEATGAVVEVVTTPEWPLPIIELVPLYGDRGGCDVIRLQAWQARELAALLNEAATQVIDR